jgi:alpha-glucosidase
MRHLALAYPDQAVAWGRGDAAAVAASGFEFMFGDDLLVAPVVDMGTTERDVWLPPGRWVDFWDAVTYDPFGGSYDSDAAQQVIDGGRVIHVRSPLGRTPLFVKAGTCLPMLPADVDTLDDRAVVAHDVEVVTLREGIGRTRRLPFAATC